MGKVVNFVQKPKPELQMNLYDMNKQAMASVDPYDQLFSTRTVMIWHEIYGGKAFITG